MDSNDMTTGIAVAIAIIALFVLCGCFGPMGFLMWILGIGALICG